MSIKSVATYAPLVIVLASSSACGAPPDTDEAEDVSTDETSSALHPRDDMPAPVAPRFPSLERPVWDLTPYIDELRNYQRLDNGRCWRYYVTLRDPGRGEIEFPITQCM